MTQPTRFDPDDCWPGFLDELDRNPQRAIAGLQDFVRWIVAAAPPRKLRLFPRTDREDEVRELFAALTANGFERLRSYENRGYPFAVWFYTVADRHLIGRLRRRALRTTTSIEDLPEAREPNSGTPEAAESIDRGRVAATVRSAVAELGAFCRLLLRARYGDGRMPQELVRMLNWSPGDNLRVAAKIRDCLARLRTRLQTRGVGRDSLRVFE